jgi:hypothetical protein
VLEDGADEFRVRFIFDPLAKLEARVRCDLNADWRRQGGGAGVDLRAAAGRRSAEAAPN